MDFGEGWVNKTIVNIVDVVKGGFHGCGVEVRERWRIRQRRESSVVLKY